MLHILRNIWDQNAKAGPGSISAAKLKASTTKTVESFEGLEKASRIKALLHDIYELRRNEERFIRGEIGACGPSNAFCTSAIC